MDSQLSAIFRDVRIVSLLLLALLTLYLMRKFSRDPRWVQLSKKLPGPYDLPLVGTSFSLLWGAKDGMTPYLTRCQSNYGSTFRLWMGNHLVVVVSDVEDIETILLSANCLRKAELMLHHAQPLFGNALVTADPVSIWKPKRKAIQPFFTKNNVQSQIDIMNKLIYKCIDKMKTLVDGPESNWESMTVDLSLEIFSRIYLTLNESPEKGEFGNLLHQLVKALEMSSASVLLNSPLLSSIWNHFLPLSLTELKKSVKRYVDETLRYNKKKAETFEGKEDGDENKYSANVLSFMSTLERMQIELRDNNAICDEITALMIAGSDTTGATVAGCLFALAAHPEIQHKVYEEINQVFGESDRRADKSDLEKLPYLEQVIKETQRLFTLTPLILRQPQTDIKIGAHIYPAGTSIIISIGGVHHNPKLYPNPFCYNPDNFSSEAIENRHRYAFIPFSAGARNCLGKTLAEMSMKLMLVAFLRTFTFHTTKKIENVKFKPGVFEPVAFGYPLSITLRKKHS